MLRDSRIVFAYLKVWDQTLEVVTCDRQCLLGFKLHCKMEKSNIFRHHETRWVENGSFTCFQANLLILLDKPNNGTTTWGLLHTIANSSYPLAVLLSEQRTRHYCQTQLDQVSFSDCPRWPPDLSSMALAQNLEEIFTWKLQFHKLPLLNSKKICIYIYLLWSDMVRPSQWLQVLHLFCCCPCDECLLLRSGSKVWGCQDRQFILQAGRIWSIQ